MRTAVFCLVILALFLLALSGAAVAQKAGDPPAKDVNVVNTPNVSVSNTPSVTVTNTPTVNVGNTPAVSVSNTPSVTVANTPNVIISNSNTQPVLTTSTSDPGRIAYQSQVNNSNTGCSGLTCFFEFGSVPAGHRLVIKHVSGLIDFGTNPSSVWIAVNNGSGSPVSTFFAPLQPSTSLTAFDQNVEVFLDPALFGGVIEIQVNLVGGSFAAPGQVQLVTLSGYELDCTAAPCAPIAH